LSTARLPTGHGKMAMRPSLVQKKMFANSAVKGRAFGAPLTFTLGVLEIDEDHQGTNPLRILRPSWKRENDSGSVDRAEVT
jgi:hypothetical protein